jgi:CrcB protein
MVGTAQLMGPFTINGLGCFLIGVLMVLITDVWLVHCLVPPFLTVGILGGITRLR